MRETTGIFGLHGRLRRQQNKPKARPASEAAEICEAMGKRLCDAHEWEGACDGRLLAPDYRFDLARAVGVGKLQGWALAAGGEAGIVRMFELLAQEIHTTLGLMGVTSLKQLNPSWVRPAIHTGVFGATCNYPVFDEENIK